MPPRYLLVVSAADPVAVAVAEHWGTPAPTGHLVDGAPLRAVRPDVWMLKRPGRHIHDERLDLRLPADVLPEPAPMVFPSIHASESGRPCFTVHPLGNFGTEAEVGGAAGQLTPAAPRWMTDALRRLAEAGRAIGLSATFEATHHGPYLERPAFFAEIGFGDSSAPPPEAVRALAATLLELAEDPADRVALGVGGGHYVPHLTELALDRRWAFGHLVSRHALARATGEELRAALAKTRGAEGIVFARAADAEDPKVQGLARRLRETEAPRRGVGTPTA